MTDEADLPYLVHQAKRTQAEFHVLSKKVFDIQATLVLIQDALAALDERAAAVETSTAKLDAKLDRLHDDIERGFASLREALGERHR